MGRIGTESEGSITSSWDFDSEVGIDTNAASILYRQNAFELISESRDE